MTSYVFPDRPSHRLPSWFLPLGPWLQAVRQLARAANLLPAARNGLLSPSVKHPPIASTSIPSSIFR